MSLDPSNTIHPTAEIHPNAQFGKRNYIGPFAVIGASVVMGDDNWIGPSVMLGTPSQHREFAVQREEWRDDLSVSRDVVIGSRNVFREFNHIHRPISSRLTVVGDDNYLMAFSGVNHDCQIGNYVTISNSVQLAGNVVVASFSNLGMGAVVHQNSVVGPFSMIGMGTVTKGIVPAFSKMYGNPGRVRGFNSIERFRGHFSEDGFALLDQIVKVSEHPIHATEEIRSALNKNQMAFGDASLTFNQFFEQVSES